jgi:hypothetical protein
MTMTSAFLSPLADKLFESVAAFADASHLEAMDILEGHMEARQAIAKAIENAARREPNAASRIALIKGDAGSGKTHVLTAIFRRAAGLVLYPVYPAILQLTAPVATSQYLAWLLDALFRELSARYFSDHLGNSPLRRLAERLLDRVSVEDRNVFLELVDVDSDRIITSARDLGAKIRVAGKAVLQEPPPSDSLLALVLLAGFDDWSAIGYLRHGAIDSRLAGMALAPVQTPGQQIGLLREFGLAVQIAGGSLAIGFDQVENFVRLGDEGLFTHALVQAVRVAEAVVSCGIVIAVLADAYDGISSQGLPAGDRDRIEHEPPYAVRLQRGTPDFFQKVVARRLEVLRQRAQLPKEPDIFAPLPSWLVSEFSAAGSVRLALRAVCEFREQALKLGKNPPPGENGPTGDRSVTPPPPIDFDKLWADHLDSAPAVQNRLLTPKKAELLAWWATEASREHMAADPAEVSRSQHDDEFHTDIIDIRLKVDGNVVERRQLALCEAPNRNNKLAQQIEGFLDSCAGTPATPAILRTKGFAKSRTAQAAPALRKLDALKGLRLALSDTEWHVLQRARDFDQQHVHDAGFQEWCRDRQWLTKLMGPLQPLIALPQSQSEDPTPTEAAPPVGNRNGPAGVSADPDVTTVSKERITFTNQPFPVFVGSAADGTPVIWDPYRPTPNALNNFGFLVTGDAGSGKTQTIRVLIDAACHQGLSVCIFDFKADYCDPLFAGPLGIEIIDVRTKGLPFNPLQPPPRGASGVQPAEHAYELAGVLGRVFRLGPVQEGLLRDAINLAYEHAGILPREWTSPDRTGWPNFDEVLDHLRDEPRAASLVTKLSVLTELGLFANAGASGSFARFIDKRTSLKLSDLPNDEIKAALAEIVIIQLHGFVLRGDQPRQLKRMIVFDEAHRVRDSVRLEALAREGRAFGVGLVIGTQFPGDIPESMAGNLATQLFLMNNQAVHRRWIVRQIYGTASGPEQRDLLDKLTALRPFDGLLTNSHYPLALLRVSPYYERQPREH